MLAKQPVSFLFGVAVLHYFPISSVWRQLSRLCLAFRKQSFHSYPHCIPIPSTLRVAAMLSVCLITRRVWTSPGIIRGSMRLALEGISVYSFSLWLHVHVWFYLLRSGKRMGNRKNRNITLHLYRLLTYVICM